MKIKYFLAAAVFALLIAGTNLFAQEDVQIGNNMKDLTRMNQGGLYDYSDPSGINIKVFVWGYVKFPGQYIVPAPTDINTLFSLAGGPTEDAKLDQLGIYRKNADSSVTMLRFNYNDIMWSDGSWRKFINVPKLQAGDVLVVPGEPKFFFKDYFGIVLSIVSTVSSIAVLLITIFRK
jgi:hypothetical protein